MSMSEELSIEVWGDYACFTDPTSKVERFGYPCPTQSSLRNLLQSIFWKPEMRYIIRRIEIMNPIKWFSAVKNEIKIKADLKTPIFIDENRTQRLTRYLTDVRYRVYFNIETIKNDAKPVIAYINQFNKRVSKGQFFTQPYFGTQGCFVNFSHIQNKSDLPCQITMHVGIMLFDVFHPYKPNIIYRTALDVRILNGIIIFPHFNDLEILRPFEIEDEQIS